MPPRDLEVPVTIVNRFHVKGDVEAFRRQFRAHASFLYGQAEFDFLVTMQLLDQPDVFIHLSNWRSLRGFIQVVRDDAFVREARRLGELVETEADQAVSVGLVCHKQALAGAASVVVTSADVLGDHREFEAAFHGMSRDFERSAGYGGSNLLRSTIRPLHYLGVSWWQDREACEEALGSEEYQRHRRSLVGLADVTAERTRHLGYERVLHAS